MAPAIRDFDAIIRAERDPRVKRLLRRDRQKAEDNAPELAEHGEIGGWRPSPSKADMAAR